MLSAEKRKRNVTDKPALGEHPSKKPRLSQPPRVNPPEAKHAVLSRYFAELLSLRDYVSRVLPAKSRLRRKKIACIGIVSHAKLDVPAIEQKLGHLLDTTIVGLKQEVNPISDDDRWQHWATLTQKGTPKGDDSRITLSDGLNGSTHSQSEILDFVTWQLFSRCQSSTDRPVHILCDGFRRDQDHAKFQFPRPLHANPQNTALRQSPWPELMKLLGKSGDRIMVDLLLDHALFTSLPGDHGNYRQLSGIPLSKAEVLPLPHQSSGCGVGEKGPSNITFVRNRMLYARAALNARGQVQFGLRHIHVLNRMPYMQLDDDVVVHDEGLASRNKSNTRRVMMYMFPRQFGLHNVFTSTVDRRETAQRLKDYTLREQEISAKLGQKEVRIPKRLRGVVNALVQKLQVSHARCSYSKLLQHHCPITGSPDGKGLSQSNLHKSVKSTQNHFARRSQSHQKGHPTAGSPATSNPSSIVDLATPAAHVSAFCQAIFFKILPNGFLGKGDVLKHNRGLLLRRVDQFVRLRRFESMSLHEIMQGMKITEIAWLAPPQLMTGKTSQTDFRKRTELFYEFLYYIFDSILIPLLRSNFYVTESNVDKYRLFFFRHDVWRYVAEPAMAALKVKMFEEIDLHSAGKILGSRQLGFSQVRLLPKGATVRPIMNLRKKMVKKGNQNILGHSINTLLKPVHTILQLEKILNPNKLGCAMSSVGDIYKRLITFKTRLGTNTSPLYFAKVDVQAAFDTIPQSAIIHLFNSIPQQQTYQLAKHVQVANSNFRASNTGKPRVKWLSTAVENGSSSALLRSIEKTQITKTSNTIFIEDVFRKDYDTSSMLQLVASHIQQNLVKIGKKYYRQKEGIPQGSVLSSTLCNYFYADLEIQVLTFLDAEDCLLLRLIDDFLLVTTDATKASRFVETMHAGVPEYGISVNPTKTLVNFDLAINGVRISKTAPGATDFPYCGTLIDTSTLNISKDRRGRAVTTITATNSEARAPNKSIFDSLTVEYGRIPGQTFQRKVLNAFKIQSHLMYLDTALNSAATVLTNLHDAFLETATKAWAYARCLPAAKRPSPALVIRSVQKLAEVAFLLATSKARRARYPDYVCDVRKVEVTWLAYSAFARVLRQKQSNYGPVLEWLYSELRGLNALKDIRQGRVSRAVRALD